MSARRMPLAVGWTLALLVIAAFCGLGHWQWGRAKQKQAMLAASTQVLQARVPVALGDAALPGRAQAFDWTQGRGHFVDGPAVLLDNQTRSGQAGLRIYRLFQPADNSAPLLVELGWLPLAGNRKMPVIALPAGEIAVQGLLAPPPSAGINQAAEARQDNGDLLATRLDRNELALALHAPRLAARVLKLDPDLPLGYARDLDILPNTLPPERHLGYAVQWFGLALAVFITALVVSLRGQHRQR